MRQTAVMTASQPDHDPSNARLSWKSLALTSVIVSLTCLVTLIVVVSVSGVDALSTVAMALAILAFVVQLIVFIVQAADTSSAAQRGQELHTQLISLLAQLQERTQGTQKSVDQMNTRLLEAILGKATGGSLRLGDPKLIGQLATGLSQAATPSAPAVSGSPRTSTSFSDQYPDPLDSTEASSINSELTTWPPEDEAATISKTIQELSPTHQRNLYSLANDLRSTTQPGSSVGPGLTMFNIEDLIERGLVEKIPGWKLYTLTDKGRRVGRIFTAQSEPPPALRPLRELRDRVISDAQESMARALSNRE